MFLSIISSLTCDGGTHSFPFPQLGVYQGSCLSRRIVQDTGVSKALWRRLRTQDWDSTAVFLVQKVLGGWKPLINLFFLSNFVKITRLKMETVSTILGAIRKGDVKFFVDLKSTYFQFLIHPDSWPYLWIALEGRFSHSRCCVLAFLQLPRPL